MNEEWKVYSMNGKRPGGGWVKNEKEKILEGIETPQGSKSLEGQKK